jgi:hypothetical protein
MIYVILIAIFLAWRLALSGTKRNTDIVTPFIRGFIHIIFALIVIFFVVVEIW